MSILNIKVHPVVLFNVLDLFERRPLGQERVIGTVLGQNDKNGNIEMTNCFVVQHSEGNGEVAFNLEVARELFDLHRKNNPNEAIVGWFSAGITDFVVNEYSVVIHEYYSRETNNPIHLTVNPNKSGVNMKAFIATPFGVPNKSANGIMFSPIKNVSIVGGYETELVGLKACMLASGVPDKTVNQSYDSEVEMIFSYCKKSAELIGQIIRFIDENILNSTSAKNLPVNSNHIGRQLMSMIESVVPLKDDDDVLNTNLKDLLMVIYLANLTKTQLMLHEKLNNW